MKIDDARVREEIRKAEQGTDARIAVHVARHHVDDAMEHAKQRFHEAHMHEHSAGNAVLVVVAPKSRKVAVYGGRAVHDRLGDAFWRRLVDEMTPLFAQNRPTDALVHGLQTLGTELRTHFPASEKI